jgi:hypothetical protein
MAMKGSSISDPGGSSTAGQKIPERSGARRRNDPIGERPNFLFIEIKRVVENIFIELKNERSLSTWVS